MISHKHKCVFVHIPKCGGQSIEDAFIKENGLTWDSREPLLLRRNDNPLVGPLWLAHLTFSEYTEKAYISKELMNSYYTFSLVRNPYSRLESAYRYLGFDCSISFSAFINRVVAKNIYPDSKMFYFFRPQIDFIYDEKGALKVNDVYKLEEFGSREKEIIEKAGLTINKFSHVNKSPNRGKVGVMKKRIKHLFSGYFSLGFNNQVLWDEESLKRVGLWYQKDFDFLAYKKIEN